MMRYRIEWRTPGRVIVLATELVSLRELAMRARTLGADGTVTVVDATTGVDLVRWTVGPRTAAAELASHLPLGGEAIAAGGASE